MEQIHTSKKKFRSIICFIKPSSRSFHANVELVQDFFHPNLGYLHLSYSHSGLLKASRSLGQKMDHLFCLWITLAKRKGGERECNRVKNIFLNCHHLLSQVIYINIPTNVCVVIMEAFSRSHQLKRHICWEPRRHSLLCGGSPGLELPLQKGPLGPNFSGFFGGQLKQNFLSGPSFPPRWMF